MAKWIEANPGQRLPRGGKAIARLTGVSVDQVKTYLYRRRKTAKKMLAVLSQLITRVPVAMVGTFGEECSPVNAQKFEFRFDHWSLTTVLWFIDFEGNEHWVHIDDLPAFYKGFMDLCSSSQEPS